MFTLVTQDGKIKVEVAREIAHIYFQMDEMDNAYEILKETFSQNADFVTFYGRNCF